MREADALAETGGVGVGVGEMLRREGLYSSHLTTWRRERYSNRFAAVLDGVGLDRPDAHPALGLVVEVANRAAGDYIRRS